MHKKFKKELCSEHNGFAVTLEALATIVMLFVFLIMILYFLRVMDVQRYMNTVMTSTAAQASRWGGVDSKAYEDNISTTPLLTTAQSQLDLVASDFGARISGNPSKISHDGDQITVKITYHLPPVFSTMSQVHSISGNSYDSYSQLANMSMQVSVDSIMEAGRLL